MFAYKIIHPLTITNPLWPVTTFYDAQECTFLLQRFRTNSLNCPSLFALQNHSLVISLSFFLQDDQ